MFCFGHEIHNYNVQLIISNTARDRKQSSNKDKNVICKSALKKRYWAAIVSAE